jgi:membrane associated rhomboid family serine protease
MFRSNRNSGLNPVIVLISVNVIIYIAQMLDKNGTIERAFALVPADWLVRPWTLLTYMFLHGSMSHVLFNMITLYFFATFVIALVGETAFLLTYFAGGVVGGLMYILFSYIPVPFIQASPMAYVIGASGAIFALGGLLMIMRPNARILMFFVIPMPLWVGILVGFLMVVPFSSNIAWQAHLGGLVYGAMVGWYYRRRETGRF